MRIRDKRLIGTLAAALILLIMAVTDRSGLCAAALLAATVHEWGHLLAARLMRIPFSAFRLELTGARLEVVGRVLTYREEWLLCAAGPIFSLLFSASLAPLWQHHSFLVSVSTVSFLLGMLNLLPIKGFDGGRMLSVVLMNLLGERACCAVLRCCSLVCLLFIWELAVYCLLKIGDGLSLFCFSMSLFQRFFSVSEDC